LNKPFIALCILFAVFLSLFKGPTEGTLLAVGSFTIVWVVFKVFAPRR